MLVTYDAAVTRKPLVCNVVPLLGQGINELSTLGRHVFRVVGVAGLIVMTAAYALN